MIGTRYASVLPEPVGARTIVSLRARSRLTNNLNDNEVNSQLHTVIIDSTRAPPCFCAQEQAGCATHALQVVEQPIGMHLRRSHA